MKKMSSASTFILVVGALFCVSTSWGMVIWRCPEFNLLKCQAVPKECRSFRMIYIRHGNLECPGCLICADPWGMRLWPSVTTTPSSRTPNSSSKVTKSQGSRSSRRQRKRHKGKRKRGRRSKFKQNRTSIRAFQ